MYVFFPVTGRLLTNVIIPVNLCSSAQLFSSILLQQERVVSESVTLILNVIDYFVMLSIIYRRFDVINDSFFVNLCSSAQLFSPILLQERVESESVTLIFPCYCLFCLVIDYLSPF